MSAPDTNIRKQRRRHLPSILGISAALAIALIAGLTALLMDRMPAEEQATPVPAPDGSSISAGE
jgi:hypothetical protein